MNEKINKYIQETYNGGIDLKKLNTNIYLNEYDDNNSIMNRPKRDIKVPKRLIEDDSDDEPKIIHVQKWELIEKGEHRASYRRID